MEEINKSTNKKFYLLLFVTEAVGIAYRILLGYSFSYYSLLLFFVSIITLHFNYELCKAELFFRVKDYSNVEPSDLRIITAKFSEWTLYFLAIIILFFPY